LHLERGRQRLDEDGRVVVDRIGKGVQIGRGQAQIVGECAVVMKNSQNRAIAAVTGQAAEA
jgi:hypothetical protein